MPLTEHARYINPYTDFGFKRLFGTEVNKDILIDFLNELLKLDSPIKDLTYQRTEHDGEIEVDRKAVYDVYCTNERGEHFIVEMQRAIQINFVERSIFYSTFPIREQAEKGKNWKFDFKAIYTVGILDFSFDESDPNYYHHEVKLMDVNTHRVLTDKLNFVYLEMPKFTKTIDECTTLLDKIMFVLKNMTDLYDRPEKLQERIFERMFEVAQIANFTREERSEYEESLKIYRDYQNTLDTAKEEGFELGRAEGIEQGRAEERYAIAANLKQLGMPVEQIAAATGLSIQDINDK